MPPDELVNVDVPWVQGRATEFDEVGLPGFQFIQDPVEYWTRTHHSNMDVLDRIQPGDLMQASAIIASFVYHAANRPEPLPRKPMPDPQPKEMTVTE